MRLQKKLERWQCVPASFAMALDMPLADLLAVVGHDGGEQIDTGGCRGFHVQEFIDICLQRGIAVTPVEVYPMLRDMRGRTYAGHHLDHRALQERFLDTLFTTRGVIEGQGSRCGHMVAYDRGRIYDPDQGEYSYLDLALHNFEPLCAWRMDEFAPSTPKKDRL